MVSNNICVCDVCFFALLLPLMSKHYWLASCTIHVVLSHRFWTFWQVIQLTRPWQTYQFSFFMPYISITPLNYWQSTENSLKWWAASSKENFGTSWKLFTWNVKKLAFLRIKNAKFMTFLTLSGNSGNSVDRHDGMFIKKFFCYFTRNKSVWLWFPASPWMNLWMIFLNSL